MVNRTLRARFKRRSTLATMAIASCIALTTVNLECYQFRRWAPGVNFEERDDIPNWIIDEFSEIDIRSGWKMLSPGFHQCTNRKSAGYGAQCSSYHGKSRAGEPVAAGVEMGIIVVNAFWVHIAAPVFLCPLILFLFVESLGIFVDVVTTVGHHLNGGGGGFSPYQGGTKSDHTAQKGLARSPLGR